MVGKSKIRERLERQGFISTINTKQGSRFQVLRSPSGRIVRYLSHAAAKKDVPLSRDELNNLVKIGKGRVHSLKSWKGNTFFVIRNKAGQVVKYLKGIKDSDLQRFSSKIKITYKLGGKRDAVTVLVYNTKQAKMLSDLVRKQRRIPFDAEDEKKRRIDLLKDEIKWQQVNSIERYES